MTMKTKIKKKIYKIKIHKKIIKTILILKINNKLKDN